MSSFVNENVSESKKPEQQIEQTQEKAAEKNIQTEKETRTAISCNVETNNVNTKTINEKKSENINENNSATATTNVNNCDNKSNYDVVAAANDKDKNQVKVDDDCDVAVATDNNQNLNKTNDNYLTTAQTSTSTSTSTSTNLVAAATLSDATCCVSNMTPADVAQHPAQQQQQQQQVASIDNKETVATSTTNAITLPTTIIIESNNEEGNTLQTLTTLTLPPEVDKSEVNNQETQTKSSPTTPTSPLPPLPPGTNSSVAGSHFPHISSEPTFGVQFRNRNLENQQQLNSTNINSSPKTSTQGSSARDWRPDTSVLNCSSVIKSGTVSASASPSMVRKTSDSTVLLPRRVSFPKSDNELVTGYLEPANPWEHGATDVEIQCETGVARAQHLRLQRRPPPHVQVRISIPRGPPRLRPVPNVEVLYTGSGRGSRPVKKSLAKNFECSGFIPLVWQVYNRMEIEDQKLTRRLPCSIFQHAMVEFLVAYQLHYAKYVLRVPASNGPSCGY